MNWKVIAGSILFVLILLAGSNFVTWKLTTDSLRKEFRASVTKDSSQTIIDTVWLKPDTIRIKTASIKRADIDTSGYRTPYGIIYSTSMDTILTTGQDTVAVIKEKINFIDGIFEVLRNIKIMPVDKLVMTEHTEWETVIIEVPADPPFYNTWLAGFISGLIALIIFAISI